jgi:hypothetical protein
MPETVIVCPSCKAKLRVPPAAVGRESIRCPKCAVAIRLKRRAPTPAPPPVDFEPVDEPEQEEELQEVLPAEDEEEEERPRRRPRRADHEEAEEPVRRRKKKRRKQPALAGDSPLWILGIIGSAVVVLFTLLFLLLINGTHGFPQPEEGPAIIKPIVLLLFAGIGCGLAIYGIWGIKNQRIWARWGIFWTEYTGTTAVLIGFGNCIAGGIIAGAGLYGMIF